MLEIPPTHILINFLLSLIFLLVSPILLIGHDRCDFSVVYKRLINPIARASLTLRADG